VREHASIELVLVQRGREVFGVNAQSAVEEEPHVSELREHTAFPDLTARAEENEFHGWVAEAFKRALFLNSAT
jgi:hypothetical protein